jgi:hypothetical protein
VEPCNHENLVLSKHLLTRQVRGPRVEQDCAATIGNATTNNEVKPFATC